MPFEKGRNLKFNLKILIFVVSKMMSYNNSSYLFLGYPDYIFFTTLVEMGYTFAALEPADLTNLNL